MAARRGKNQATRNSGHATPAWVWLVLGLLIGLAVYFIVPGLGKKDGDSFFRPQPNPDARPAPIDSADVEAVVPDAPASDAPATAATPVLIDDAAARDARMALALAVRQALANGLDLLGVSAPEKM